MFTIFYFLDGKVKKLVVTSFAPVNEFRYRLEEWHGGRVIAVYPN